MCSKPNNPKHTSLCNKFVIILSNLCVSNIKSHKQGESMTFKAICVDMQGENLIHAIKDITIDDLSDGDVVIEVKYSSINYKDMLAFKKNGGVICKYPMIPGIDLCGEIVESKNPSYSIGQKVLSTGFGIGVSHTGGYAQYARLQSSWITPLPNGLSLKDSMIVGTAGFTAALSIQSLQQAGMHKDTQPTIAVTGATGGVGTMAIALLKAKGYDNIIAITSKNDQSPMLKSLGASKIVSPKDIIKHDNKPLQSQCFDYVIDCVGGALAASLLTQISYGGAMSVCGNASGIALNTNILPFILRGIQLVGIDSVAYPSQKRSKIWYEISQAMAFIRKIPIAEVTLETLAHKLDSIQHATNIGRNIVSINNQ